MSPLNSKILAFANGVEYHLASWIAVFVIDRIGRRKLMIFGALGMSGSMAVLCGTIYAATETDVVERGIGPINGLDNKPAGYVAAAVLFIYVRSLSFASAISPIAGRTDRSLLHAEHLLCHRLARHGASP